MTETALLYPQADLRPPSQVMRLERMGSFFPTRLSFMRSLIRQLSDEHAQVTRPVWEIDDEGFGRAVYSVDLGGDAYSLVAFSTKLAPEDRTDRVIAQAWDTTYVLFDGVPSTADLDRLQANAPKQEAGRFLPSELVLCRANKSVRLFEHVADRLASGEQPDADMIADIGYLMRTTAVYGNGKFGISDRARISERAALAYPFRIEMLAVWLVRGFTHDLVEHVAKARNPKAAKLSKRFRRYLGIGNSTGLGMAPFLVNHPILLNNWMMVRETALARVCAIEYASRQTISAFLKLLPRARLHVEDWTVEDARQKGRIETLRKEMADFSESVTSDTLSAPYPWARLISTSDGCSVEAQEFILALVLEPHGDLIDGLTDCMSTSSEPRLNPMMSTGTLKDILEQQFSWATSVDFDNPKEQHQFWYVSEEKLEPRLGERHSEPGAEKEEPLDIARQVQALGNALNEPIETVAELAMRRPDLRNIIARVQAAPKFPYAEIQDNLIGQDCLPIDMLRCKLSFFGASKFDPKSDRWTRITMFQGAPGFDDITGENADDWAFPVMMPE